MGEMKDLVVEEMDGRDGVKDVRDARLILEKLVNDYRNALDALSLTAEHGAFLQVNGVVRDLEAADKFLVKALVKLAKGGSGK